MEPIPAGTLVMSFKLSIGRVAFTAAPMYSNEAICHIREPRMDPRYLYYALPRVEFDRYGKQAVKGFTLNSQSLREVQLAAPSDAEQHAIAQVLSDMDDEIEALVARRDKTVAVKVSLMDELLTGRTRLV